MQFIFLVLSILIGIQLVSSQYYYPNNPYAVQAQSTIRQCLCWENDKCRDESFDAIASCYWECGHELQPYGVDPARLTQCFVTNLAPSWTAAKACVKQRLGERCSMGLLQAKTMSPINFAEYEPNVTPVKTGPAGPLIQRARRVLAVIRKHHHCVRQCVTRKVEQCFNQLGCTVGVPSRPHVKNVIHFCTDAFSGDLRHARSNCQCLLANGVTEFEGLCHLVTDRHVLDSI